MSYGDLLPAYRDYKTAKEAKAAFLEGKDWIISSLFHPSAGKYINLEQIQNSHVKSVILRFCNQTKITNVKIPPKSDTLKPSTEYDKACQASADSDRTDRLSDRLDTKPSLS